MSRRFASRSITTLLFFALIIFAALAVFNSRTVQDWIKGRTFTPSAKVEVATTKLALTSTGDRILRATHPEIESETDFNLHCVEPDTAAAILGCYTGDQIYIYDINSTELSGITESTLAHELLHAVWARLTDDEKSALTTALQSVYTQNKSALASELENYDASEQIEELHSRIGTQIANLPANLESHYAAYFSDQDAVVSFYKAYNGTFTSLKTELDSLKSELDSLSATIDEKTAAYLAQSAAYGASVQEFNTCAETANCFATTYDFNVRRNELLAERAALDALYDEITALTNSYNQKVVVYNQNALHTRSLQNAINSTSSPTTI